MPFLLHDLTSKQCYYTVYVGIEKRFELACEVRAYATPKLSSRLLGERYNIGACQVKLLVI